ncbi:hypothetical protein V8E53_007986 [Lactarius tabidus]
MRFFLTPLFTLVLAALVVASPGVDTLIFWGNDLMFISKVDIHLVVRKFGEALVPNSRRPLQTPRVLHETRILVNPKVMPALVLVSTVHIGIAPQVCLDVRHHGKTEIELGERLQGEHTTRNVLGISGNEFIAHYENFHGSRIKDFFDREPAAAG